jgi:hypothetical protein
MAASRRPSVTKRQKEHRRAEKRNKKEEKRRERDATKGARPEVAGGEDPDIAGIVPGPQPIPDLDFE